MSDDPLPDDLTDSILAAIASLPVEEQPKAIHALLNSLLGNMPDDRVSAMRAEIVTMFPDGELPIIESTLNLIDGHLALRELRREDPTI